MSALPAVFVLAHGAGGSSRDPLLVAMDAALVARGHRVTRFDFAYRREGRRLPDRAPALETEWRGLLARVREQVGPVPKIIAGGKSMGGRMASHLAALSDPPMDALLLLGYPLHPAGRPDKLRDAHLAAIVMPSLFVSGTKDELCNLRLLRPRLKRMGPHAELFVVRGGDHGLALPKRSGTLEATVERVADRVEAWLEERVLV